MKKFGTPIGAAPGSARREGRVLGRRRAVRVAARVVRSGVACAPCRRPAPRARSRGRATVPCSPSGGAARVFWPRLLRRRRRRARLPGRRRTRRRASRPGVRRRAGRRASAGRRRRASAAGAVTSWTLTTGRSRPGNAIWSTGVPAGTSSVTVTWRAAEQRHHERPLGSGRRRRREGDDRGDGSREGQRGERLATFIPCPSPPLPALHSSSTTPSGSGTDASYRGDDEALTLSCAPSVPRRAPEHASCTAVCSCDRNARLNVNGASSHPRVEGECFGCGSAAGVASRP